MHVVHRKWNIVQPPDFLGLAIYDGDAAEHLCYLPLRYATHADAAAAIGALNGALTMLGGDRPLVVKFANSPKASRTETGSGQNNRCQGYASQGRASHPSHSNGPSSENRGSSGYKLFVGMVPFSSCELFVTSCAYTDPVGESMPQM